MNILPLDASSSFGFLILVLWDLVLDWVWICICILTPTLIYLDWFNLTSLWFLFRFRLVCLFININAVVLSYDECIGMSYLCWCFCKQHELVCCDECVCIWIDVRVTFCMRVCCYSLTCESVSLSILLGIHCIWELVDHGEKCVCGETRSPNSQRAADIHVSVPSASTHSRDAALLLTSAQSTRHCLPKHRITHPGMVNLSKIHTSIFHCLCMSIQANF